eukprot:3200524-Rhodomonas_salina.1
MAGGGLCGLALRWACVSESQLAGEVCAFCSQLAATNRPVGTSPSLRDPGAVPRTSRLLVALALSLDSSYKEACDYSDACDRHRA